jgi:hypothetical protein
MSTRAQPLRTLASRMAFRTPGGLLPREVRLGLELAF